MPLTVQCYERDGCFDEFMHFCKIEKMNLITWIRDTLACLQEQLLVAYNQPGVDWITKLNMNFFIWYLVGIFTPGPLRSKRYCRCLRLSVRLSVHPPVNFTLPARWLNTSFGWNHLFGSWHASGTLSAGIENWCHKPWSSRLFWPFWSPNMHRICIAGFSRPVLKMGVIDLDLQSHLAISTQSSKKRRSTSLLHTDLGQPKDVIRPNVSLLYIELPYLGEYCITNCFIWHRWFFKIKLLFDKSAQWLFAPGINKPNHLYMAQGIMASHTSCHLIMIHSLLE